MAKLVPLISSGNKGPLGVLHLPRFWQKVLLAAKGMLADGYPDCGGGYDSMVLAGLKLDKDATLAYLRQNLPSYAQFEKWVLQQRGGSIPKAEIEALNSAIAGYNHGDDTRKEILGAAGIADDGRVKDAVTLNQIDDWTAFHAALKG